LPGPISRLIDGKLSTSRCATSDNFFASSSGMVRPPRRLRLGAFDDAGNGVNHAGKPADALLSWLSGDVTNSPPAGKEFTGAVRLLLKSLNNPKSNGIVLIKVLFFLTCICLRRIQRHQCANG